MRTVMKEIEAIQMRKDLLRIKEYGFTDSSISRYIGNISDRAIREFVSVKNRMLSDTNHNNLKDWIDKTLTVLVELEN